MRIITAGVLGFVLAGCAGSAAGEPPAPEAAPEIGEARVGLLGNYAGRALRIEVEGRVLVEGRLPFPPPGAEDRYLTEMGPERVVDARVEIEGCEPTWSGQIRLVPLRTSYLLIQGCDVQAFRPE